MKKETRYLKAIITIIIKISCIGEPQWEEIVCQKSRYSIACLNNFQGNEQAPRVWFLPYTWVEYNAIFFWCYTEKKRKKKKENTKEKGAHNRQNYNDKSWDANNNKKYNKYS